jgi:hypothetical protein
VSIAGNPRATPADALSMTDSISRRENAACRLPGDEPDHDDEAHAAAQQAGQSEKPRQSCMLDVDWNEKKDETPFGPPRPPVPGPKATNNATRTQERDLASGPYAEAGYSGGGHALHAGVALVKGRDASGLELEALTASVQVGGQNEAQGAAVRVSVSGARGSIGGEAGSANVHAGIHNPDGSTGVNAGGGAVWAAGEATLSGEANSVTVGAGIGVGGELSVGLRDKNGNGEPEVCIRASLKFAMVGACLELPFHGKM